MGIEVGTEELVVDVEVDIDDDTVITGLFPNQQQKNETPRQSNS